MSEWIVIQVVRCDGRHETLTLAGPVTLHGATENGQGSIRTSTGTSHFFTYEGKYDGWESEVNLGEFATEEDALHAAHEFAAEIEKDREITEL